MASNASSQPRPAYETSSKSPLYVDRDFYTAVATAGRETVERIKIAPRDGKAWLVPAGGVCRVSTPEGPQVGDLNIWNQHNASEHMWTARSRQLHSSHLKTYDRLWSVLPYMRPLVTVIDNSLENFGVDGSGGRVHDLLGTRCDPYIGKILGGDNFDFHCHSNLVRAIKPFGLVESNVHDNVNLFQVTGLTNEDQYFINPCPARVGDYIEFFAEVDLLFALSACPAGDETKFGWGTEAMVAMEPTCRPLLVEVFKLVNEHDVLKGWKSPQVSSYQGHHGL